MMRDCRALPCCTPARPVGLIGAAHCSLGLQHAARASPLPFSRQGRARRHSLPEGNRMDKPSPVCPVCQRKRCTEASHKRRQGRPSPWGKGAHRVTPRPVSWAERERRRKTVAAWRAQYGNACPACGAVDRHLGGMPVVLTADHAHPVRLGGDESGPLRVMCRRCQGRQGAAITQAIRGRGAY
jgi:hypothetical protein